MSSICINSFTKRRKCTESVEGKVVDIARKWDNNGSTSFYPIFEYTVNGNTYVHQSQTGSRPCRYHIGQNIEIHFNPEKPEQFYDKESNITGTVFGIITIIIGAILMFAE